MSNFTIGDDLRGVLVDVAKSDKQRLFAGNYFKNLHTEFAGKPEVVGIATPGLSSAERELVTLHRRELSMCLLQGFYAHFVAGNVGENLVVSSEAPRNTESRKRDAQFARDFAPAEAAKEGTMPWLHRLLEGDEVSSYEDFLSLSAAAARLTESPCASLYQGYTYYAFGKLHAARNSTLELARKGPPAMSLASMRTLQSTLFSLGQPYAANAISYKVIGMSVSMGWQAEVVEELCRLAVHRLSKPQLRSQKLPPPIEKIIWDLERPLTLAFSSALTFAKEEVFVDPQTASTSQNIVQILTELRS